MEHHPFIGKTEFKRATTLLIGSFPCFKNDTYGGWYYDGEATNCFWRIIGEVYNTKFTDATNKQEFCRLRNLAITDLFLKIERAAENCKEQDMSVLEYNIEELCQILNANPVYKIILSGKLVKSHFDKIAVSNPQLKKCLRNIKVVTVVSPLASADRSINKMPEFKQLKNDQFSLIDFRKKMYYQEFIKY